MQDAPLTQKKAENLIKKTLEIQHDVNSADEARKILEQM